MTPESQPLHQEAPFEPSKKVASEMSFGAAMRRAVDDLFTYQAIGEKLPAGPKDEGIDALLETWKQGLTLHLQEAAQGMVQHVVANLNLIQSGASQPLSEAERLEWQRLEHWYTPFPIATICREDLRGLLPDTDITSLSDEAMTQLATQMSDLFHDTGIYSQSLNIATKSVLTQGQDQPPEPPLQGDANNNQLEDHSIS
jgi:hypothetical protein